MAYAPAKGKRAVDLAVLISRIAGPERSPRIIPSSVPRWALAALDALLRGCFGAQLFVTGRMLVGGGPELSFRVASGIAPIWHHIRRGEPVLSLGSVKRDANPLNAFHAGLGLGPVANWPLIKTTNGLLIGRGSVHATEVVTMIATNRTTEGLICRHYRGLLQAAADLAGTPLATLLPQILGAGSDYLLQSCAQGYQKKAHEFSSDEFAKAVNAGLNVAAALARSGATRLPHPAKLIPPGLPGILPSLAPQTRLYITTAIEALQHWQMQRRLISVPMHGDLWLENIFFNADYTRATAIIDWEDYDPYGIPLLDAIRLIVTSVAAHRRTSIATVMPQIWTRTDEFVSRLFDDLIVHFKISKTTLAWLGVAAWLNYISNGLREPRPSNFDRWLEQICEMPGSCAIDWLNGQPHSNTILNAIDNSFESDLQNDGEAPARF